MRKKLNQQLFVYLLMLSLVITLGMYVQPLDNTKEVDLYATSDGAASPEPSAAPTGAPLPVVVPSYSIAPVTQSEKSPVTTQSIKSILEEEPTVAEKHKNTYEVTAYYLNIRTKPNAQSDIIKVVKQGTVLEVAAATGNGWLELHRGGFIHGGYAKKIRGEVKMLSVSDTDNVQPAVIINEISPNPAEQDDVAELEVEPGQPTSVVESDSGLTEAHIEKIFKGTALSGHGLEQAILEIEDMYGINAYFTIAVMKLESGNGKSRLAKRKNNLFGLNAIDGDKYNKAFSFKTKGDSVRKFGQLLSKNYVGKGLTTIEKVAKKYCPANSRWPSLVKNIMKSDFRKL